MKIRVPTKKTQEVPFDRIPRGAIYMIKDSPVPLLKLAGKKAVLLAWPDGSDWLELVLGFKDRPASEILGYIDEIILRDKP